jgi:hypothetical protein
MVTSISKLSWRVVALNTNAAGSKPLRIDEELSPEQANPPTTPVVELGVWQLDPG